METQKTPQQRMELATSQLLRCFSGPDLALEYISRIMRLCAEGMQHEGKTVGGSGGEAQHIERSDLGAVAWLAGVQTEVAEINQLETCEDVSFDIKRPEWYQKELQAQ